MFSTLQGAEKFNSSDIDTIRRRCYGNSLGYGAVRAGVESCRIKFLAIWIE